jgi:hypothetical protein
MEVARTFPTAPHYLPSPILAVGVEYAVAQKNRQHVGIDFRPHIIAKVGDQHVLERLCKRAERAEREREREDQQQTRPIMPKQFQNS